MYIAIERICIYLIYGSWCCPHIHMRISFHAYMLAQYCVFPVLPMLYLYIPSMISLVFSYSYGFWIDIHCNLLIFFYHPLILYVQTTWLLHLNTSKNVNFNISHFLDSLFFEILKFYMVFLRHPLLLQINFTYLLHWVSIYSATYNIMLLRMILFIYI